MIIGPDNIQSLIPQRAPFVMVDALVSCEENSTRTVFKIRPDNIFLENGILAEAALIENIAQTAAARAGWISKKEEQPVAIGYISARFSNWKYFHFQE